jgi:hypothetical protein
MKKLLVICLLLAGCSAVKQVLKDPAKVEIVGREWEKKNPCVTDSFVTFVSDTLIKFDTTYKFKTDTLNKLSVIESIDTVFINKTIRIKDSTKVTKADLRRLDIALDSVNHYKGLAAYNNAQFEAQAKETKEQKHLKNKWMIKFWLLFILLLLLFALYLKFNK